MSACVSDGPRGRACEGAFDGPVERDPDGDFDTGRVPDPDGAADGAEFGEALGGEREFVEALCRCGEDFSVAFDGAEPRDSFD